MQLQEILDRVSTYAPDADLDVIMRAYLFSAKAHAGQFRRSGEPYLTHPLAVAGILTKMSMDVDTIATALLHDTIEDTLVSQETLSEIFSPEIGELVDGVTKIGKLQFRSKQEAQAENFRKMLLAISRDIRVILVKLADRLHNMRTLDSMREDKQARIARETMDIFVPIANRLGLGGLKTELQDLCFRYLHPDRYTELARSVAEGAAERDAYIERNCNFLHNHLGTCGIDCDVSGRAKTLWSIHCKMIEQNLEFDQVHDLLAFRVLVDDVGQCYAVLGQAHALFSPIPDRIKDYIAIPKANGYRSLHTTVIGPEGRRIEIQVRTHEQHRIAENGISAHWRYKEGHLALDQEELQRIVRLRELIDAAREVEDSDEFLQTVKIELFTQEVYVFTPAGDVKVFPVGATSLDFAYAVHTEVGNACVGAKVDGRMVPLRYELRNGDTLEILTSPHQKPSRDWLQIAQTGRALSKIRRCLREEERERGRELGREMLENELKKHGVPLARTIRSGLAKRVARDVGVRTVEQLFLAVATGNIGLMVVVRALAPDVNFDQRNDEESPLQAFMNRIRRRSSSPVLVGGEQDVLVGYARCCNPLPGEPVAGFITRGRGITIHLATCPQLLASEPERKIAVEWDNTVVARHHGELRVVCADRPGLLANISKVIESAGINISRIEAHNIGDEKSTIHLEVAVTDISELHTLIRGLERIRGVLSADRVRG